MEQVESEGSLLQLPLRQHLAASKFMFKVEKSMPDFTLKIENK